MADHARHLARRRLLDLLAGLLPTPELFSSTMHRQRDRIIAQLTAATRHIISGPRQAGKTTLQRLICREWILSGKCVVRLDFAALLDDLGPVPANFYAHFFNFCRSRAIKLLLGQGFILDETSAPPEHLWPTQLPAGERPVARPLSELFRWVGDLAMSTTMHVLLAVDNVEELLIPLELSTGVYAPQSLARLAMHEFLQTKWPLLVTSTQLLDSNVAILGLLGPTLGATRIPIDLSAFPTATPIKTMLDWLWTYEPWNVHELAGTVTTHEFEQAWTSVHGHSSLNTKHLIVENTPSGRRSGLVLQLSDFGGFPGHLAMLTKTQSATQVVSVIDARLREGEGIVRAFIHPEHAALAQGLIDEDLFTLCEDPRDDEGRQQFQAIPAKLLGIGCNQGFLKDVRHGETGKYVWWTLVSPLERWCIRWRYAEAKRCF